jgi:plasmid stabilization system protein ParE
MPRLIWSAQAAGDLQRLFEFLADHNPEAARKAMAAIQEGMRTLRQFPEIGRPVEQMDLRYRDWPIGFGSSGYIARYRLEGDALIVLWVRHQREMPWSQDA